jgi:hypothetical protein
MGEFRWMEEQVVWFDEYAKNIKKVSNVLGHKTLQSYVNALERIVSKRHTKVVKIRNQHTPDQGKINYHLLRIDGLNKLIPTIQLLADTETKEILLWKKTYGNGTKRK